MSKTDMLGKAYTLRAIFLGALLLLSANSTAQNYEQIHNKHIIYGMPTGTSPSSDLIIRDTYAMSANETTKFADWVAYRLTPEEVWGSLDLTRKWRADPWLEEDETLEPSGPDDYKGANSEPLKYDRGHLAPLASFKGTAEASSVNYYSNITPQAAALNQGPWKDLEEAVRRFVKRGNTVWVITGPLYETAMDDLPNTDEPHAVPSGFWKVIATCSKVETNCKGAAPSVFGVIMEQTTTRNTDWESKVVSLANLRSRSGLNQLPSVTATSSLNAVDINWFTD
ncbi:DNA/RNA non-specific endonuclease [Halieaceae bacterium IMCC14734]|uniref:Endonuclease n=1 Tax=Candidatus Litorirhabdus singularis TaxID=2518993 RepID=A0ABT3TMA9_9GAMM|nr:DNA/RNA non-specific endonuclease [Candidatus Litorirhabdus singularis]MCX2983391.1 DNA/RNA non-specific endonuclease [Candidatus Litorirhabdus singularis]